jgi:SAM-dependent methyltransferase
MAHSAQLLFMTAVVNAFPELFSGLHIEIGSQDINGNLRDLIKCNEYVGVDLGPAENVTWVGRGEAVDFPSDWFDSSFSGECFEHNLNYLSTFFNMIRMTKPGGIIAFTCASRFRMEHGTTSSDGGTGAPLSVAAGNEYYRNLTSKHFKPAIDEKLFLQYRFYRNFSEQNLYFVGIKNTTIGIRELETRFYAMDLEIQNLVSSLNRPGRVIKTNISLLKMSIMRSTIKVLHRTFSPNQIHFLKKIITRNIVQN